MVLAYWEWCGFLGSIWMWVFGLGIWWEREREHDYMKRMGFVRYTYIYPCSSICSKILYSIPTTSLNRHNERSSPVTYFSSIDWLVFRCGTSISVWSFSVNQLLNTTTHNAPFFFSKKKLLENQFSPITLLSFN